MTVNRLCNNIVLTTMQTQTIFRAGNSDVVAIPQPLLREVGFKRGQEVVVSKDDSGEAIVIEKSGKKSQRKDKFKKWFDAFLKENGEILDELALR